MAKTTQQTFQLWQMHLLPPTPLVRKGGPQRTLEDAIQLFDTGTDRSGQPIFYGKIIRHEEQEGSNGVDTVMWRSDDLPTHAINRARPDDAPRPVPVTG